MAKKPDTSVVSKQIKKALATGTYDREVGEALRAALQALAQESAMCDKVDGRGEAGSP